MMLPASVDDNVVTCHSAEHPCGASALRGLTKIRVASMPISIHVFPQRDGGESSFASLRLFHAGCSPDELVIRRDPATNSYSLKYLRAQN
jgi:hypothetical protein